MSSNRDYFDLFSEVSHKITSSLESEEVMVRCLQSLINGLKCEAASIFLSNPISGEIELFVLSDKKSQLQNLQLGQAEGIVGWVIENKKAALVPDVTADARFTDRVDKISHFTTRSVVAVPLIHSGKVTGALEILNPIEGEFIKKDVDFCEAVAGQLATVIRNIDLFKQTEELLKENRQLDEMKSTFITMASHELFTPLTKIKLQTQLLGAGLCGNLSKDQKEGIQRIIASVDQLTHIARDLTNMNLLESEGIQVQYFSDYLNSVLLETIEEIGTLCKKRNLTFITYLDPDLPEMLLDRRLVTVLVRNLLLNAIRFTPDGGEVTLTTKTEGSNIEIIVADNGVGIDPEDHQNIFQSLFSANDTTYHHSGTIEFMSGGLGLGLPITRSITHAHKGKIWVESEKGKGSKFFVSLPIEPPKQIPKSLSYDDED